MKKEVYKYGNPEKGLKKDYDKGGLADMMINTLADDDFFNFIYAGGDKEVIVTGEIDGITWKGKIDSLVLDKGYFCDIKTVDGIHKRHYNPETRINENFIVDRHYTLQMALYQELIKQTFGKECQPFIFAVSKQTPPDKGAFDFNGDVQFIMKDELENVLANQHHIWSVLMGETKPTACGKCEYCREHKQLDGFEHVLDIEVS